MSACRSTTSLFSLLDFFSWGVLAASIGFSGTVMILLVLLSAGFVTFSNIKFFASPKRRTWLIILLSAAFLGFLRFYVFELSTEKYLPEPGEEIIVEAIVKEAPIPGGTYERVLVELVPPYRGAATLYLGSEHNFNYGDRLRVIGEASVERGTGIVFGFPKAEIIARADSTALLGTILDIKRRFVGNIARALPPGEAALAAGITVGERSLFSRDFKEAMRASGTTHIVALSGYNISIIGLAVFYSLGFFMPRRRAFWVGVAAIMLFVIATGAEASVVRAAIMGTLVLLAERTGRIYSFRNAFILSAFAMVLLNPSLLVFDIGFQLSFGALFGIVVLKPKLQTALGHFFEDAGFLGWKENALTSASAQLTVLPLIIFYFGEFNPLSLLANILILEAIPPAMALSFALGVFGFLSDGLAFAVAMPAALILKYAVAIVDIFSKITLTFSFGSLSGYVAAVSGSAIALLLAVLPLTRSKVPQRL